MTHPDNDPFSGYRPDMDQYRVEEEERDTSGWWILPAAVIGLLLCWLIVW